MINFEITASPSLGKKNELEQSLASIHEKLVAETHSFEAVNNHDGKYKFIFNLRTKEEAQKLFRSEAFILITGAMKTLCHDTSVLLNGKQIKLNDINNKNISNNSTYKNLVKSL